MIKFRTEIKPERSPFKIDHRQTVVFVGSCFSDNIASEMMKDMFSVAVNPCGVMYNPASIANTLNFVVGNKTFTKRELVERKGMYHSMNHHSDFSSCDAEKALAKMNQSIARAHKLLEEASTLILTFGTSNVFIWNETGEPAGNCHKFPAREFSEKELQPEEIAEILSNALEQVFEFNPNINVILTISPVRYLTNGLHESNLSKARLHLGIERVIKRFGNRIAYFPAYEIVIDDLRDYRFYAEDLVHPAKTTINYVYDLFGLTFFTPETISLNKKARSLTNRYAHRFLTDNQEAIETFREVTVKAEDELKKMYPFLSERIENLRKQCQ